MELLIIYIVGVILVVSYMVIFEYFTNGFSFTNVPKKVWITDFALSFLSWLLIPFCIIVLVYALKGGKPIEK